MNCSRWSVLEREGGRQCICPTKQSRLNHVLHKPCETGVGKAFRGKWKLLQSLTCSVFPLLLSSCLHNTSIMQWDSSDPTEPSGWFDSSSLPLVWSLGTCRFESPNDIVGKTTRRKKNYNHLVFHHVLRKQITNIIRSVTEQTVVHLILV